MRVSKLLLLTLALSGNLFAQDIKVVGTLNQTLKAPQNKTLNTKPTIQQIKLLKMQLSNSAIKALARKTDITLKKPNTIATSTALPSKVELGMNNVPVLNQGSFGTCVTFAATAAVDAALNKGDYISQLCQLQLGLYLEKNGHSPSGWDGSLGRIVLSQMENFGIVSKEKQKNLGCGGLTEYPDNEQPTPDHAMSLEQFHEMSEDPETNPVIYTPILDVYQAVLDRTDTNKTINDIKTALNQKDRVTFAVLLLDFDLGVMGAVGTNKTQFDTWVLTPEIARDIYLRPFFGGHEMIITGYDDNAIAVDDNGREHKGLFTLRNSWGEQFGDKGNFYMSYDYFKVLTIEAQRIRALADNESEEESMTA
ncbi:C1 family peptidase [Legionella pneumophila]|uniref:C1 family peptidase n=1 Tax=Legionella pneumophila TaxID=446 RepID=UPI000875CE69|nr:C1 family peptidase [Legionella pneumophila]AOW58989.1 peptidase C1 [Legionella pneumophila subsp. pneumophila]AOW60823.1 peptidase C1 [Legionella pneumophila subsp. pneumophila]AOW66221.1 peptidase C1 [Legionella pneumophila subsp. pneumophila]HAT8368778.1 peptidase C1 [Legionella pneumophila]